MFVFFTILSYMCMLQLFSCKVAIKMKNDFDFLGPPIKAKSPAETELLHSKYDHLHVQRLSEKLSDKLI